MTQTEVNKIIQEKVVGQHYRVADINNPDFSQWQDYGPLLEEIQGREWWWPKRGTSFMDWLVDKTPKKTMWHIGRIEVRVLLNPTRGSLAIAEFVLDNPSLFEGKED